MTRFSDRSQQGEPIQVGPADSEPRGMVFAEELLWVALAGEGTVTAIDPDTNKPVNGQPILVGKFPLSMAEGFGSLWVTNRDDGTVSQIDPVKEKVVDTLDVGGSPEGIASDDSSVWVTTGSANSVRQIDPGG